MIETFSQNLAEENTLKHDILKVKDFLKNPKLQIPIYQRPYKWTQTHVAQLIGDIKIFCKKPSYRFGTVVIHENTLNNSLDIVDGQQRSITLLLTIKALMQVFEDDKSMQAISELREVADELPDFKFSNPISQQNVYRNYKELLRLVADFDEEMVHFLLNKCEFIVFKLNDISEAFQFFDSQNARGKDLDPHDLLKAFHLRAFDVHDDENKFRIVDNWENADDELLAKLFALYLFRIKGWAKAESSRDFSKNDIYLFKGIDINELNNFPYSKSLRILHHYIDEYNNSYYSRINQHVVEYPFQITEPIINGRRFFEMIENYYKIFETKIKDIENNPMLNDRSKEIINVLNNYEGRWRTGDQYTRLLFDTILIFYVDKFGEDSINTAIQFFFIWSFNLRLQYQSLQFSSVDNYVLEHNYFKKINDSFTPKHIFDSTLYITSDIKSSKTKDIVELFKSLNYL
jgi:Uncharacterized conserved protein